MNGFVKPLGAGRRRKQFCLQVCVGLALLFASLITLRFQSVRASPQIGLALAARPPEGITREIGSARVTSVISPVQEITATAYLPLISLPPKIFLPLLKTLPANFPQNPIPADFASGQSPNAYLAWEIANVDGSQLRYEIYLEANDSTPDELIAQGEFAALNYDPATFAVDTPYYWQIVSISTDDSRTPGPVWAFRTEAVANPPDVEAMVLVPAGEFRMGCDRNNAPAAGCAIKYNDLPLHTVYLDAYEIDKYEVTNKQYRDCLNAGACRRPRRFNSHQRDSYFYDPAYDYFPVLYVSYWNGQDYCAWKGKRLPTEAEWEKAARGPIDTRSWPWGQEFPDCSRLNFTNDVGIEHNEHLYMCIGDTTQVGSYPASASVYGAMDMAGNVFEWTADLWNQDYYARSPYLNPPGPKGSKEVGAQPYFALRGGSYRPHWYYPRAFHRHYGHHGDEPDTDRPFFRNDQVGFRCARSVAQ